MDCHHAMVLVLLQEPDDGSDELLKLSHAQANLTSLYNDLVMGNKGKLQDSIQLHGEGQRDSL